MVVLPMFSRSEEAYSSGTWARCILVEAEKAKNNAFISQRTRPIEEIGLGTNH